MIHVVLPVGMLQCNCSVFGDESTREAIVIDPGDEIDKITAVLTEHRLRVKAIVITHAHIDHVAGAHRLRQLTHAPIYMNERDSRLLDLLETQAAWLGVETPPRPEIDTPSAEGTVLSLGGCAIPCAGHAGPYAREPVHLDPGGE